MNPKTVIIIGGGIADVTAAEKLGALGHRVTLLEARDELGGRARNQNGISVGPMVAHEVGDYEGEEGIPGYIRNHPEFLFSEQDLPPRQPMPALLEKYGIQLLKRNLETIFSSLIPIGSQAKNFNSKHFEEIYLEYRKNLRTDTIIDSTSITSGDMEERLAKSLVVLMEEAYSGLPIQELTEIMKNLDSNKLTIFKYGDAHPLLKDEGYQGLILGIARDFKNVDVQLNTFVKKLDYVSGKVRATTEDNAVFEGDAVIVTVPLGALQKNTMEIKKLSDKKRNAIRHLKMGLMTKVVVRFEKQFWTNDCSIFFVLNTDLQKNPKHAINPIINPNRIIKDLPPTLIGAYFANEATRDEESLVKETVEAILAGWPDAPPPLGHEVISWHHDPYTYGSYAGFSKETHHDDVVNFMQPDWDGRFIFAGDAAVPIGLMGCFHGAYISALRAARLIDERLKK